jgi:hypothetical protein
VAFRLMFSCVVVLAMPGWAQGTVHPKVLEASQLIDELDLEAALSVLESAEKMEGNDRATVLAILAMQGATYGTLGKEAKTRDCFRKLLLLDPEAQLPADLPPRVRTPFYQAKEWASVNGPLSVTAEAETSATSGIELRVQVSRDVLKLGERVRFTVRSGTGVDVTEVPLSRGLASLTVDQTAVTWSAEVLNDRYAVIWSVAPQVERVVRDVPVKTPALEVAPAEVEPLSAVPVALAKAPMNSRRWVGGGLLLASAAAVAVGAVLGVQSTQERSRIETAARDELGRVNGLTQRDAVSLESGARTKALAANVLFGLGAAAAIGGMVLVLMGPPASPALSLRVAPGALVAAGSF